MTINNYITLDSKRYATKSTDWTPGLLSPNTNRITLSGDLDATWGASVIYTWKGMIHADITPRAAEWGNPTNLETSLAKKQKLSMTDHYGTTFDVVIAGWEKSSQQADWEASGNEMSYNVEIRGVPSA